MTVQFAVLASGSQGNATLIETSGAGILVDLGLGPRAMATRLESVGSTWDRITSAVLTHTHGDHIDDATLHRLVRHRIVLYCHEGHRGELSGLPGYQALDAHQLVRAYDEQPFLTPGGFRVEPLELRHDGGPTFGFRVEAPPDRRGKPVSIGYLADTGSWSDVMSDALTDVDLLGVEFNHDVALQRRSGRSAALIARNLGDWGHLSNDQGAALLTDVLGRSTPGTLRHVVLLHLSQQCNRPELALGAARVAIRGTGRRIDLHAARQAPAYPNVYVQPSRRRLAKAARGSSPSSPRRSEWLLGDCGTLDESAPPF